MRVSTFLSSVFWWIATVVTLFLLDDLIFGPFFWSLSLYNKVLATVVAFLIPIFTQQWLIRQALQPLPAKVAKKMLSNLSLERKNAHIRDREEKIKTSASHYVGAALSAILIGGVIPTLVLYKQGYPRDTVLRFSWIPTLIYATEYALLHGGWGFGGVLQSIIQ